MRLKKVICFFFYFLRENIPNFFPFGIRLDDLKNLAKLVKSHVDVNERDDNGMSALHLAAEKGSL